MNVETVVAFALSILALVYLLYALLRAEKLW